MQRELKLLDNTALNYADFESWQCVYAKFLYLAAHNPNNTEEPQDFETRVGRFNSFCTAFGYMLHSYKNPGIAKMILAVDHKIGEKGDQNGGSGKNLAGKSLENLKHTTNISGKDFKEDYQFKYEMITPDSQIVCFNDLRPSFNMECLFENITGDWLINRRHTGYLVLPFNTSPKIYSNTNFVMKGEGSSFLRRLHIIEFSDYFNDDHSPLDEFGHQLFNHWDADEWNRFDNFMLQHCCSFYLKEGLIKYPGSNYDVRKLRSEVPEEFIDFFDRKNEDGSFVIARNVCHRKLSLLEDYRKFLAGTGAKDPTAHMFTKWLRRYCKTNGYEWNAHCNGKRDSSGPQGEFVSVCDENFDREKCLASRGALFKA